MWSLLYLVVRALVRLLVRSGRPDRDDGAKDLEILVLRHQLRVLQRDAGRPKLRPIDRVLLAANNLHLRSPHTSVRTVLAGYLLWERLAERAVGPFPADPGENASSPAIDILLNGPGFPPYPRAPDQAARNRSIVVRPKLRHAERVPSELSYAGRTSFPRSSRYMSDIRMMRPTLTSIAADSWRISPSSPTASVSGRPPSTLVSHSVQAPEHFRP